MTYHTAIVGSGSGGLTVAVGLSKLGKKVALIERHQVGGDCTNVGCVPSKALIHLSKAMRSQGLTTAEVLKMVRERRDHLREEEEEWLADMPNVTLMMGEAKFASPHELRVTAVDGSERMVQAKNIVLSTGSRANVFPIEGLDDDKILTNESMFDLEDIPGHLVIIGGGVIGVEMAFAFRRLGSSVSLVDRGERLLKALEPEVSEVMKTRFQEEGISLYSESEMARYEGGEAVLKTPEGELRLEKVDRVLIAAGRLPNLDMGLEAIGVEYDRRGIDTDSVGRTSQPNVYAIGDINRRSAFTHSANNQGRRLVQKLALPLLPVAAEPHYPSATFADPEIAQVGPSRAELEKKYHPRLLKTETIQLKDMDRGYTSYLEHGFVMITAMKLSGKVLSATIVGPNAGEMLPILTHAVNGNASMYQLAKLVFPYPTLAEAIKRASNNYVFSTLPSLHKDAWAYLRYRFF